VQLPREILFLSTNIQHFFTEKGHALLFLKITFNKNLSLENSKLLRYKAIIYPKDYTLGSNKKAKKKYKFSNKFLPDRKIAFDLPTYYFKRDKSIIQSNNYLPFKISH